MITKLTAEQEGQFAEYRDKWLRVGLTTGPPDDWGQVRADVNAAYVAAGLHPPCLMLHVASPAGCLCAYTILQAGAQARGQVWDQVWDQIAMQVRAQIWGQVQTHILAQIAARVQAQIRVRVVEEIRAQVWAQVHTRVARQSWDQIQNQVGGQIRDQIFARAGKGQAAEAVCGRPLRCDATQRGHPGGAGYAARHWFVYGCHDAALSFYDYVGSVLGIRAEPLRPVMRLAAQIGWWLPYAECCIVSMRPVELYHNASGLHRDGGPAVLYDDGWSVWALNGVCVPREIAETPWDRLDPRLVLAEKNAEVRREIVRKIGIERVCAVLGAKTISTWEDYELLLLDLGDGRQRPYLKMRNPSIGVYHIEGIHPDCTTVAEALAWRNGDQGNYVVPDVLS